MKSDQSTNFVAVMNPLKRALIEKAGHDNGFENVLPSGGPGVELGSARHPAKVSVTASGDGFWGAIQSGSTALARWLRRAAKHTAAAQTTEVQRMVRQRVGQQAYRQAMLDYWGGACAVTGLALPQALRASHAKPWAECASDAERLDVFNGFLLSANLDVLFDSFLVSFSEAGELMVSKSIPPGDRQKLGITESVSLRWISAQHGAYLDFHRQRFCSIDMAP